MDSDKLFREMVNLLNTSGATRETMVQVLIYLTYCVTFEFPENENDTHAVECREFIDRVQDMLTEFITRRN